MRLIDWLLGRDDGRTIEDLSRRLKLSPDELRSVEITYREFQIPKRSKGVRTIRAPSPELRRLQRRILYRLLNPLKCHPAATGFERGSSIVHNALPHAGQAVLVKMDIKDFFPTIDARRIIAFFRKIGWNRESSEVLARLCTHEGRLPQGAPTSPRLSNLVCIHLDERLQGLAKRVGAAYTRYADDITFSLPEDNGQTVRRLIHLTNQILKDEGYEPHWREKLYVRRRCDRQVVTGLVVNDKVQLPRQTRRWLRAVEHRVALGRKTTLTEDQLEGWLSLRHMIEEQTQRRRA